MSRIVKFEVTFSFPEYSGRTMYESRLKNKVSELLKYDKDSVEVREIKKTKTLTLWKKEL